MEVQICRPDAGNVPTAGVDGFEHAGRGLESYTWTQSRAAHNTHLSGWLQGSTSTSTTPAAPSLQAQVDQLGGPTDESKIDSIQNVFLLRADLHESWDDYKFGVNPDGSQHRTTKMPWLMAGSTRRGKISGEMLKAERLEVELSQPTLWTPIITQHLANQTFLAAMI
ncbi:uncharacterized protein LACBIDRAFT_296023 [Laccaria bicolor S238N-H82]|uniref:Predicted protein n=1 Tax=Laccaria bicolor (strain S238N-H82 / ATCC MYA-4686) TaxID=486041 RepID=B0DWK3_LACBS|nr:uncharacterized protein LACBIDRAFT_333630 [Laccaria bicolor S238N-H82]XP_001890218.1 uncharacterized protein LACBIDRAFT_296023 [Laccaria bicolor S238N-H82]EDQ99155.1 predicted protein [Laccaria bicolor S238N-H82]EDR01061.1 predicted protein [Laccaria bicolor S238N-H82]|eukprot:XP_001888280.1 predicted protein [Laccaria bicolor S238N-H82]